jgi:hypothetical protein
LRRPTHGWGWCLLDSASSQRRTGQRARHCLAGRRGLDTEQVAAGIRSIGTQAVQQRLGRALDTRPTIEVESGQLCLVLLSPSRSPSPQYGSMGGQEQATRVWALAQEALLCAPPRQKALR